jgi:hypothetical protein
MRGNQLSGEVASWMLDLSLNYKSYVHQFSNSSAISCREKVNFQLDDDKVRFVIDQHAELDFMVLAH